MWALIDVDLQNQEPPFTGSSNVWPIQPSPPESDRWKPWTKQYGASVLGMPPWNMEDLLEGYVFSVFSISTFDPGHVV